MAHDSARNYLSYLTRLAEEACDELGITPQDAARNLEDALGKNKGHTGGIYPVSVDGLLNTPDLLIREAKGEFSESLLKERLAGFLWFTSQVTAAGGLVADFDLGWKLSRLAAALEYPALRAQIVHDLHSTRGRHAADARHGQPGGSRDKQRQIREIWATGKYSSRDICAEEECAALGMSFAAARKALRNTPNP